MTSPTSDFSLTVLAYATTASARRPASVIRTRVTAIGVLEPRIIPLAECGRPPLQPVCRMIIAEPMGPRDP